MSELSKEDKARFEFAREYFERRLKGEKPKWQVKLLSSENWTHMKPTAIPFLSTDNEYRFTPKTIVINGVQVVAPRLSINPAPDSSRVWTISDTLASKIPVWENSLVSGTFVYENLEDIEAFRAAMLKAIKSN